MSDDLTFSAVVFRAHVQGGGYYEVGDNWAAWVPTYPCSPEMVYDPSGEHWPGRRTAAIEACRKHNVQRMGAVSMAPAGPVSVDADGAPV
jgi:hypothetical protein